MSLTTAVALAQGNQRRTWILVGIFVGLFAVAALAMAWIFGELFFAPDARLPLFVAAATLAGGAGLAAFAITNLIGADRELREARARPLPTRERPDLHQAVDELSKVLGVVKPGLWWSDLDNVNAFAVGRDSAHAKVVVFRGLEQILSREELRAVLAHEISHIRNDDMRIKVFVHMLSESVLRVSRVLTFLQGQLLLRAASDALTTLGACLGITRHETVTVQDSRGRVHLIRREKDYPLELHALITARSIGLFIVSLVLLPFTAIAAFVYGVGWLTTYAVSRQREFLADATAAACIGAPATLADALERVHEETWRLIADGDGAPARPRGPAYACFSAEAKDRLLDRFGATHPEMEARIRRLRKLAEKTQ